MNTNRIDDLFATHSSPNWLPGNILGSHGYQDARNINGFISSVVTTTAMPVTTHAVSDVLFLDSVSSSAGAAAAEGALTHTTMSNNVPQESHRVCMPFTQYPSTAAAPLCNVSANASCDTTPRTVFSICNGNLPPVVNSVMRSQAMRSHNVYNFPTPTSTSITTTFSPSYLNNTYAHPSASSTIHYAHALGNSPVGHPSNVNPLQPAVPINTAANSMSRDTLIGHSFDACRSTYAPAADITLSTSQIASRQVITKDLPAFSGKSEEWPIFITNYMQSTERCGFTDQENLIRLQKCLKGEALEAVRGKLMTPANVSQAIATLAMLYGRPEAIHQALQRKLRAEPQVKADNLDRLIHLALAVQNYRSTMEALGLSSYLNDPMLLNDLVEKLPSDLKLDWGRKRLHTPHANISFFDEWLFSWASCASQVTSFESKSSSAANELRSHTKSKHSLMLHEVVSAELPIKCQKCQGNHKLMECDEFLKINKNERWAFIKAKKLCIRCFGNHFLKRCPSKKRCNVDGCQLSHHPFLHTATKAIDKQSTIKPETMIFFHKQDPIGTLFRYVPVTLSSGGKSVDTYAMIDEGSACTLIENDLAQQLGVDGPTEELCLRWTGEVMQNEPSSKIISIYISSRGKGVKKHVMKGVRTISSLNLPQQSLDKNLLRAKTHLKNLPVIPYTNIKARILIGVDNAKLGVPIKVREKEGEQLIATKSRIGWAVYGRSNSVSESMQRILHICNCNEAKGLDELMRDSFSLESVGVAASKTLVSKEDERAMKTMEKTTTFLHEEKRWETGLLWRFANICLPDSYGMALRRLKCLEAKMDKDIGLKNYLNTQIQSYIEKGYARKRTADDSWPKGMEWFIPIFTVFNKHKNKTRLVWDAAAKVQETALNSVLLKGPDLLASLPGILIRFRERPFAICGDIKEMFHQVRIRAEDQGVQQFLWRDGDDKKEPCKYVLQVMTFGASCSPSLANYVKNRNASRFADLYPSAVAAIHQNTFVDDWLQSVDGENEMIQLAMQVKRIHADGGFVMRNWMSNSRAAMIALNGNCEQSSKRIEEPDKTHEKVLGMWWLPQEDMVTFEQKFETPVFDENLIPTKRQVLRVIMSVFDPLGLLGCFTSRSKVIMQNIWRSGIDWDDPLQTAELNEWRKWTKDLPSINTVKIPRAYELAYKADNLQLHVFVDASVRAYAAVAYLRAEAQGQVRCSLIASKTRVAPLKPISIPRLELMAAILGLRLAKFVEAEMSLSIHSRVFWSDSQNVLCWIRSDARKFHQFVGLRVGEILENSHTAKWRWVPSDDNVADDATKWQSSMSFNNETRWFKSPHFLYNDESDWPREPDGKVTTTELESVYFIRNSNKSESTLLSVIPEISRFSRWEKLCRAQGCVLSFLRRIMKASTESDLLRMLLHIKGHEDIENLIIRFSQEQVYGREIQTLKAGKLLDKSSQLFKCSPYLCSKGVLRIRGRIDSASTLPTDGKRPIILPRNHYVTKLIIDFYHRKMHHHHNEIVVNEVRQRFFVYGLRSVVKAVAKNCQLCRNRRVAPQPPEMGSLPAERLTAFVQPFTYTGVDFFGPVEVTVGRRRERRWGVLFTCMTIRAVHLELCDSLSTDAFLLVLKQFIARRGAPRKIFSDNGTNFRGASKILASEIAKISTGEVNRQFPHIEWQFIPPASPHMGGAWERMIRSVKSILMEILVETAPPERVLRAAFAEVEHILNSRPLTYVPLDTPESEALTPNHFLVGSSSGIREDADKEDSGSALRRYYNMSSHLADSFWKRWLREYLPTLTRRTKWFQPAPSPIVIGDIVMICDAATKRNTWVKGIVVDLCYSFDGQARSATIKTQNGFTIRPIVKLAKMDVLGNPHCNA